MKSVLSEDNKEEKISSSQKSSLCEVKNFASLCLDKSQDVNEHRAHLPHGHQDGKLQFVTFRLADSLPQEKLDELEHDKESFVQQHPQPWDAETEARFYKLFGSKIDEWLDAGMGSCLLKFSDIRKIVCDALCFFDGERYRIHSYVVMPNHVHVLVEPFGENKIGEILHSWKSFTANEINKQMGSSGAVWRRESFDRIIRDEEHYQNVLRYISDNPKYLPETSYTLGVQGSDASCVANMKMECDAGSVASLCVSKAVLDARANSLAKK